MLNVIILILYRFGYGGDFLGIGGTWNLNEEKSPDAEIIASGVYVGFLIYTSVQLFTYLFGTTKHKRELSDTIMNVVGVLLWLGVAGTALHYWHGYQAPHDYTAAASERMVSLIFWTWPKRIKTLSSVFRLDWLWDTWHCWQLPFTLLTQCSHLFTMQRLRMTNTKRSKLYPLFTYFANTMETSYQRIIII